MRIGGKGAMKTKSESKKFGNFGKMWKPGDKGQVFFPIFQDEETGKLDLLVGAIWGHKIDMGELGLKATFVPCLTDVDDAGNPVGTPDITYQFSRFCRVYIDGEKKSKLDKLAEKNFPTEAARKTAIEKVEKEFDTQNNMKAKKPVIGKLDYVITTECLYVPIENEIPQPDKARMVTREVSGTLYNQLIAIMNDKQYKPEVDDEGLGILEVSFSFPMNDDKGQSGRDAKPNGVTREYSLATTFPEQWASIQGQLVSMPRESETIMRRNYIYHKIEEKQILQAIQSYCVIKSEFMDVLADDEDSVDFLKKHAITIRNLGAIENIADANLKASLEEEIQRVIAERGQEATEMKESTGPDLDKAQGPAMRELVAQMQNKDDDIEDLELAVE